MSACWSTRPTTSPHAWVGARRPNGWMSGREDACRLTSPLAEQVDRKLRNNEGSGEGSSVRVIADPAPLTRRLVALAADLSCRGRGGAGALCFPTLEDR